MFWIVFSFFVIVALTVIFFVRLKTLKSVIVSINNEFNIEVQKGDNLLLALGKQEIYLPAICNGGGTCTMCKCQVISGGGVMNLIEKQALSQIEIQNNYRLACQLSVKENLHLILPSNIIKC